MYSLSTCWNSHRHTDGRAMLREVRELGFEYAELGHGTRISLMPGILEAVDAGEIKISSLHNFCPLPMGVTRAAPNLFQFSSPMPREREQAERYTRKTMEFANRVKASLVVLHLGSIEMKDYNDKMLSMLEHGEQNTTKYQKLCQEVEEKRESKKEEYFERVKESIKRLLPEAEQRGLRLGAENRQAIEELPLDGDFYFMFREISSPNFVYWHDTGHAQIKEHLGYIHHRMHLESLKERLAGFHIHDVQYPGKDHCPPGTGTIDFAGLKPFVQPGHLRVLELSPSLTPEQVREGFARIRGVWGEDE